MKKPLYLNFIIIPNKTNNASMT